MSRFKIVNLLDKLFVTIAIFLIVFAWINFYLRSLWTTFIISIVITFACVYILFYFSNRKREKKNAVKESEEKINKTFLAFKLSTKQEKLSLVSKCFASLNPKIKNGKIFYVKDEKTHLVIFASHINVIGQTELINLLDEYSENADCYDIICASSNANTNIYQNKQIDFIDKNKLLALFESSGNFPNEKLLNEKINKTSFKDILKTLFLPHKAKSYFFCGLILIFSSIILPYHYYYIIFGSVLLLFSIVCKLLPKFKS